MRRIDAVVKGPVRRGQLLVAELVPRHAALVHEPRDSVDGGDGEAEAVRLIADGEL